jgi:hypothetical protein
MKRLISLLAVGLCVALLGFVVTSDATAQGTREKSFFTLTEPLDVGGTILQPGDYKIKVIPLQGNRNMLQVRSADADTLFATLLSIPHTEAPGAEKFAEGLFIYYPASVGSVKALRTWFAGDTPSTGGHDIVYSKERALELAALAKEPVVAVEEPLVEAKYESLPLGWVTPERQVRPWVAATRPPAVRETVPVQQATYQQRRLPQTASNTPLYAGLGFLSILGAFALGVIARRVA